MSHLLLASALACTLLPSVAGAQGVDLRSNVDFSGWTLSGTARVQSGLTYASPGGPVVGTFSELILTDQSVGGAAGAGFAPAPVLLNLNQDFTFQFHAFMYGPDLRGDGMTFVLTPNSNPQVGGTGSDLGYGGSALGGYAFAIDTFNFTGEPVSPSLQILTNGSTEPLAYTVTGLGDSIRHLASWTTTVEYRASGTDETGTLTGTIERQDLGTFSVSASVDWSTVGTAVFDSETGDYLGRQLYFGFTASNGAAVDGHLVTSTTLAPVPEPETWAMLLVGLGLVGWRLRQRAARLC